MGDYQFELSSRADLRWPLSMCFYKLISRTADVIKEKGKDGGKEQITVKAQYTLSQPGLLTPERRYYWHVRAMDEKALVWGNEKVLSTTLERVGAATQKFIIDVQ